MEIWKPVDEFTGWYEVSSLGRIRRIKAAPGARVGRILRLKKHKNGYPFVILCVDGITYTRDIHRVVAKAFVANPASLPEVNHKDGTKSNNASDNLEWSTSSHNKVHALKTGLRKTKLNPEQIVAIRASVDTDLSLSAHYGVSPALINFVKNRVYYKHVPEQG